MPDHFHIICRSVSDQKLSDILRDLKKVTSRFIIKHLKSNTNNIYSRWLEIFQTNNKNQESSERYKLWQDGFNPKELSGNKVIDQKIEYLHNNPVKAGLVTNADDYLLSSSRIYAKLEGVLEVFVTHGRWMTH